MIISFGLFMSMIVVFLNPILNYEIPKCEDNGKLCYTAEGRNCLGYKILDDSQFDASELFFVNQNQKKIAIIKIKLTFDAAVSYCKKMCGTLWAPTTDEFDSSYNEFSQTCYEKGIGDVFIGALAVKTQDKYFFKYVEDPNSVIYSNQSEFIDRFLDAELKWRTNVGKYPLVMKTDAGISYNKWRMSNYTLENFFACQETEQGQDAQMVPNEQELDLLTQLKKKFELMTAPKLEIPGTDTKLSLITYPRNVYEATAFCNYYANGVLYDVTEDYKTVVEFAQSYEINEFYVSLNDQETENNFMNNNGAVQSNDFDWWSGEPNNFIPDSHQFCEADGEDFVVLVNGKLSDVRGFSRYPFFCQYQLKTPLVTNIQQQCLPCKVLINNLPLDSMMLKMTPEFQMLCKNLLMKYFQNESASICSSLGLPFYEIVKHLKKDFLDNYSICSFYEHCNKNLENIPNDNCAKCKFIFKELKAAIQGLQITQFFGKYMPHIVNLLTFVCSDVSVQCQNLDFDKIIKQIIGFMPLQNNFTNSLCFHIGACN